MSELFDMVKSATDASMASFKAGFDSGLEAGRREMLPRIQVLEAALRKQVEWFDAELKHVVYESDGGAHWNYKLRLAQEAEDMARAAVST